MQNNNNKKLHNSEGNNGNSWLFRVLKWLEISLVLASVGAGGYVHPWFNEYIKDLNKNTSDKNLPPGE